MHTSAHMPQTSTLKMSVHELTLNRAHKVVERLQQLITQKRQDIAKGLPAYITPQLDAAGERMFNAHRAVAVTALATVAEIQDLTTCLSNVRTTIGRANEDFGISGLIAQNAHAKMTLDVLESLQSTLQSVVQAVSPTEFATLVTEHAAAQEARAKSDSKVPLSTPSAYVRVVTPEEVAEIGKKVTAQKALRVQLSDSIATQNLQKVSVHLPDDYLNLLLGIA